jgi:tripartite-type tricarboxylate transporter receptor subunit TctC
VNDVEALMTGYGTLPCVLLAATLTLSASAPVVAQEYPTKPVKIVVAFPPGGGADLIARVVAQRLTTGFGQQFIVENKPGAGGSIGFRSGIMSPPDGYTLTIISSSYAVNPSLYKLDYDPVADITPVIEISQGPLLVVVHPSLTVRNLKELIALAKSKPGQLNFATGSQGTGSHLATELLASMAGIKITVVNYKGIGPALTDTIGGQTNAMITTAAVALPHVKSGRLRALAVTTSTRVPAEPDIPTVAESGVPGYEVVFWYGLVGPKRLPRPIVDRLNAEVTKALKLKETAEQLQSDGQSPAGGSPEQLLATIKKEIVVWRKVVRDAGVKAE